MRNRGHPSRLLHLYHLFAVGCFPLLVQGRASDQASAPRVPCRAAPGPAAGARGGGCERLGYSVSPGKRCLGCSVRAQRNNNWRAIECHLCLWRRPARRRSVASLVSPSSCSISQGTGDCLCLLLMGLSYVGLLDHLRSWQSCGRVGAVACLMMVPVAAQFAQMMVTSCIICIAGPAGPPAQGVMECVEWP